MGKIFRYAAHFKPIILPPLERETVVRSEEITIAKNPQPANSSNETLPVSYVTEAAVIEPHQQFVQQQTTVFQYFLQQQKDLWQQCLQYPGKIPNSVSPAKFNRQDLEQLASGKISSHFGDWFKPLDQYQKLIRLPEPPLLLADRIIDIQAEPGSMQLGMIRTETDVTANAWYLHHGRMPMGIMIESGQCDLLLVSWLGLDFYNRGERVYRLLGSDLTYYGELPKPGDTLCYEIHVDGYANSGDIRLFFFHYDCYINGELRLRVRNGQAGFFTEQELKNSSGVLWDIKTASCDLNQPFDPPTVKCQYSAFNQEQLQKFSQGKIFECFGKGFELALTHSRTPRISDGKMLLINRITEFDPTGGIWQRGYMRAEQDIHADDWFFKGHFKNDPCMPGTLMFEAGLQVMSCYLTALGYTLERDGWRFELIPEKTYHLTCRGQVVPQSKQIVYEIFVHSVIAAPIPTLIADLLATVDGLKAFHMQVGLHLIPDWPQELYQPLLNTETKAAPEINGFKFDYASLLACALGRPTAAFGNFYHSFNNHRRVARLPGPPYHFIHRIIDVKGNMGEFKSGAEVTVEYDIPKEAWYFEKNVSRTMPFCVLLEAALQPCGWLASYVGSTLTTTEDLLFRNLDGDGTLSAEILPGSGTLRTHVRSINIAPSAGMIIESFVIHCYLNSQLIFKTNTVFGFFPKAAFENQTGLPIPEAENNALTEASDFFVDMAKNSPANMPQSMLLMFDRITGFWPEGGEKGLGRLRAEKTVNPDDWFFKAHFFQDPVQPGSLGLEALLQLMKFYLLQKNPTAEINHCHFQPLALDTAIKWKYRGQVLPTNKLISLVIDIVAQEHNSQQAYVIANGSLWVDGKRIYEAKNLSMTMKITCPKKHEKCDIKIIDPAKDTWVNDHKPNYIMATLPMMSILDHIAKVAQQHFPEKKIISLQNVQVLRWAIIDKPLRLHSEIKTVTDNKLEIAVYLEEENFSLLAKGVVHFAKEYPLAPLPPEPLTQLKKIPDPYYPMFHGPAFHVVENLQMGASGSSAILNADLRSAPFGFFNQVLLDGITHCIPQDHLTKWCKDIAETQVAYPLFISKLTCFMDSPKAGKVQCEVRFTGFHQNNKQYPQFEITLLHNKKVWLSMHLVEILLSKGPVGLVTPDKRKAFLQAKQFVPEIRLSQYENGITCLTKQTVKESDWIPGSLATFYQVSGDLAEITKQIAVKEHFAHILKVHPTEIIYQEKYVFHNAKPEKKYFYEATEERGGFVVNVVTSPSF